MHVAFCGYILTAWVITREYSKGGVHLLPSGFKTTVTLFGCTAFLASGLYKSVYEHCTASSGITQGLLASGLV